MQPRTRTTLVRSAVALPLALGLWQVSTGAQDRLKTMPGYEQFQKVSSQIPGAVKPGATLADPNSVSLPAVLASPAQATSSAGSSSTNSRYFLRLIFCLHSLLTPLL